MEIGQIVAVALLVEALWETVKMVWKNGKFSVDRLGALVLGIGICMLAGANLFEAIGIPMGPHLVGCALTGVLASRGSNFLHDLFERVQGKSGSVDDTTEFDAIFEQERLEQKKEDAE